MHRPSIRRLGVGTLLALVASIFAISVAVPASAANLVDNNGWWIQKATGGVVNFVGNPTTVTPPVAPPECSDGVNNDEAKDAPGTFQDTAVDFPADPQCASATDNSETYTGDQAKSPISFGSFITKAGAMTSLVGTWPSSYIYTTQGLVTFSVAAAPSATPSSWDAGTGAVNIRLNLTLTIKVEAGATSFACSTAAFPVTLSTSPPPSTPPGAVPVTRTPYSPATGMVTVADNTFQVPATSNSVVQGFCDLVNSSFGLPVYNATTPNFSVSGASAIQFDLRSFPGNASATVLNNTQPTAVAGGNQTVAYGAPVTLTGGGTDTDPVPAVGVPPTPGPIFFKWTQTAGPAVPSFSQASVSSPGANVFVKSPTFTPPAPGDYTFQLQVADGAGTSYSPATATTSVHVNLPAAPVAADDTYSTPFDTPLTVTAPGVLGNDSGASISVTGNTAPSHGSASVNADGSLTYTPTSGYSGSDSFTYTVTDVASQTSTATVNLTVDASTAPVASAGDDQYVRSGDAVTLDGTGSSDPVPGPSPLTYAWTQTSGPAVTLSGATTAQPTFTAPVYYCNSLTDFTFKLTVGDGALTATDSITVTVTKVTGYGHPIGDYNGDGTADPAVYNPSTATWQIRCQGTFQFGAPGDIAVPGDYNGDGTTDVATYTPKTSPGGNGTWVGNEGLWKIRNRPTFRFAGLQGDIPVPADYFNDSSAHAAFYRPSTGQWIIRHGLADGTATITKPNFPLNLKPVAVDLNGDGKTDIAAIDPATGKWYQNGHGIYPVATGQAGDVAFAGDYDGNGTVEIGRYRGSSVAVIDGEPPFYFGGSGYLAVNAWFTSAVFTGGG